MRPTKATTMIIMQMKMNMDICLNILLWEKIKYILVLIKRAQIIIALLKKEI